MKQGPLFRKACIVFLAYHMCCDPYQPLLFSQSECVQGAILLFLRSCLTLSRLPQELVVVTYREKVTIKVAEMKMTQIKNCKKNI